jgi:polygalacturonase
MANVKNFGAVGDGKTDDTAAFEHAVQMGDGQIEVPRGDYVLTRPIVVPLDRVGRFSLVGLGGQGRLIMRGAGPALHLVGTHNRTADPSHFQEAVWQRERFPTLAGIEIVGEHAEADGVRIEGTMQSTLSHVLIRRCRYGVHLVKRARNVILDGCHIYNCRRIGVYMDRVNLHQINIYGCHISYNPHGGIRIEGSEVRNIQICGNDIEYNYDEKAESSADVWVDAREGSVREGTIVGNTIQARESPNGANIRLVGVGRDNPNAIGVLTISGNLLGSQETVLHLVACRGLVISGNAIYSGYRYALRAADCVNIVFQGNTLDYNSDYKGSSTDALFWERCTQISLQGNVQVHTLAAKSETPASWTLQQCRDVVVQGCQILAPRQRGLLLKGCERVLVSGCRIGPLKSEENYLAAIEADDQCRAIFITQNLLTKGRLGDALLPSGAGQLGANLSDQ